MSVYLHEGNNTTCPTILQGKEIVQESGEEVMTKPTRRDRARRGGSDVDLNLLRTPMSLRFLGWQQYFRV